MKQLNILFAFILTFLASCVNDEIDGMGNAGLSAVKGIHIIGAVEDFDMKMVRTRAEGDDQPDDSYISEMTMFIFDKNGNIVQGYSRRTVNSVDPEGNPTDVTFDGADKCSSAINIRKANPTFVIDTKGGLIASLDDASPLIIYYNNLDNADALTECQIYIVANAWHELKDKLDDISKLDDLKDITIAIDGTLAMPKNEEDGYYRGFPMIGTHANQTFNLRKEGENEGAVAKIPLKKLYSKVRFTMQVNANQVVVGGQTPKFQIKKVEVFNVPTMARLGRELDNGKPVYGTTTDDDYIVEVAGGSITESNLDTYYQFTNTGLSEEGKFSITDFNKTTVYHSASATTDDIIEFGFYMPEHKVTPTIDENTYPDNLPVNMRQNYKPMLVGATRNDDGTTTNAKLATFVRIHGTYTDHNGQIKEVRYDIYLGQNNTDDFTIKRNQLLNNKLVITGLSNYHDAYGGGESVSIDHRVDVDYKGFNLSVEREAILDSHFEVRPLDVELSPGSTMIITIPDDCRSWLAMEDDRMARDTENKTLQELQELYINTGTERKGVRKYFTTNLVSELTYGTDGNNGNKGKIQIVHNGEQSKIFRIWFYIDENPNVYDKLLGTGDIDSSPNGNNSYSVDGKIMYRNCPVQFKYFGTDNENIGGGPATVTETVTVNFQQWNLWRVWNTERTRYYDIEHEEEYLNIYASDQSYGETQDGMPFGLEGIQLSNSVKAYWKESANGILASIINYFFGTDEQADNVFEQSDKSPYYDFYLSRDNFPVAKLGNNVDKTRYQRDYKGLEFNKEIAATLKNSSDPKAKIDGVVLTEDPVSAFSYCYNKNKRDENGTIDVGNIKWYLPAIDEIEDIALGAYDEFDKVFQNKAYWSCQPAYDYNSLQITGYNWLLVYYQNLSTLTGEFYTDDLDRARATSVTTDGTNYTNIKSGLPAGVQSGKLSVNAYSGGDKNGKAETSYASSNINYENAIYKEPSGEFRGNKKRTEFCRIRAVYRSGEKKTQSSQ